ACCVTKQLQPVKLAAEAPTRSVLMRSPPQGQSSLAFLAAITVLMLIFLSVAQKRYPLVKRSAFAAVSSRMVNRELACALPLTQRPTQVASVTSSQLSLSAHTRRTSASP